MLEHRSLVRGDAGGAEPGHPAPTQASGSIPRAGSVSTVPVQVILGMDNVVSALPAQPICRDKGEVLGRSMPRGSLGQVPEQWELLLLHWDYWGSRLGVSTSLFFNQGAQRAGPCPGLAVRRFGLKGP